MPRSIFRMIAAFIVLLVSAMPGAAQAANPYPKMASLDQYLMTDRNAEIALAKSAAPPSIAGDAKVLVFERRGYVTAVQGKNGFVCIVERSWMGLDDTDFWNPQARSPICFNAAAARFNLPIITKRTELALAGRSKAQIFEGMKAAFDKKEIPPLEPGSMCFMLSKQGHLNNAGGPWHPHVMFFEPLNETAAAWGGDSQGSPVITATDPSSRVTIFMIPVAKWSDGTADSR